MMRTRRISARWWSRLALAGVAATLVVPGGATAAPPKGGVDIAVVAVTLDGVEYVVEIVSIANNRFRIRYNDKEAERTIK